MGMRRVKSSAWPGPRRRFGILNLMLYLSVHERACNYIILDRKRGWSECHV